jgi:outer membrane cobalamin receptor
MFRYRVGLSLLCCALLAASLFAEESGDVFLSLTRKYEPLVDLPTGVSVITPDQIQKKNARNLGEIIENETGITRSRAGTLGQLSDITIRGSSSKQVLVLIDGRRVNSVAGGTVDLNTIAADSIERVEIIRGAASAIYGTSAFGGVINVITKKPKDNEPLLDLSFSPGSFNTRNYQLGFSTKKDRLSGVVTTGRNSTDGWRKNSDYDNRSFFCRLGYDAEMLGVFDLSGSLFNSELGVPGQLALRPENYDGSAELTAFSPTARQNEKRQYVRLENVNQMEQISLKTAVYTSNDIMDYQDPTPDIWTNQASNLHYDSLTFGGEAQINVPHGLTIGGEWWQEKHRINDLIADATTMDRSRTATAVYLQEEWRVQRLNVIPSLRLDDYSAFGSVLSPRLSLVFHASDLVKLSASSGKTWRAPTFIELYYPSGGNPDLKPEEGIASDLGVEYAQDDFRSAVSFFYTTTDNLISGWPSTNIGKSMQTGAEFEVGQKIASGLSHRLNYTYLWAEDSDKKTWLTYHPRNIVNYAISCLMPWNMTANLSGQYVSEQKTETFDPFPEVKGYTVFNLGVTQRFRYLDLWASVDNIANVKYQTRAGYPLPGTVVSCGCKLRFWV